MCVVSDVEGMVRLKESKIFWPLVLFPFAIKNANTRSYTGRCWVKDIKASFGFAKIILTHTNLTCKYKLFNLLIFDLSLSDIDEVNNIEDKPGLILIKFQRAKIGRISKFALSGQPSGSRNQVIINVNNEREWLNKLKLRNT
jgi:hypothetical protein